MAKPDFYLGMIDRMAGGTPTKSIMQYFCKSVEAGEQPDQRIMAFLASAFQEIIAELDNLEENEVEGKKDPKRARTIGAFTMKALNLNGKAGRSGSLASKNALGYGEIVRDMVLAMDEDELTYEDAVVRVAKKRSKSEKTVKKAYSEFGDVWRSIWNSVKDYPDNIK